MLSLSINGKRVLGWKDPYYKKGHITIGAIGGEALFDSITITGRPDPEWLKNAYEDALDEKDRPKADKAATDIDKDTSDLTRAARKKFGNKLSGDDYQLIDRMMRMPGWRGEEARRRISEAIERSSAEQVKAALNEVRRIIDQTKRRPGSPGRPMPMPPGRRKR
jgi:hypothetical protein